MFPGVIKAKFFNNVTVLKKKASHCFLYNYSELFLIGWAHCFSSRPNMGLSSSTNFYSKKWNWDDKSHHCCTMQEKIFHCSTNRKWTRLKFLAKIGIFKAFYKRPLWWLHDSLLWYHSISSCYISWPLSVTNWNNKGFMGQTAKKTFQL